ERRWRNQHRVTGGYCPLFLLALGPHPQRVPHLCTWAPTLGGVPKGDASMIRNAAVHLTCLIDGPLECLFLGGAPPVASSSEPLPDRVDDLSQELRVGGGGESLAAHDNVDRTGRGKRVAVADVARHRSDDARPDPAAVWNRHGPGERDGGTARGRGPGF